MDGGPKPAGRPAISQVGKMSLGKEKSSDEAERLAPPNIQAWDEYMQNRFNGSISYESLGARFSKSP